MPTLYPPEYPLRPDAPLLSFGPSFSEDIARSVIEATWHENDERPNETNVRAAAALTMLEACHPRDHLEVMLAAQGVGFQCAVMDSLARATRPGQSDVMALKFRASAALMSRSCLATVRELDRRQAKPLPPRPPDAASSPAGPPPNPPPSGPTPSGSAPEPPAPEARTTAAPARNGATGRQPPRDGASAETAPPPAVPDPVAVPLPPFPDLSDVPEIPEDIETRPDGTPGTLSFYAPKPPPVKIPRVDPLMALLADRPQPYQLVNDPGSKIHPATGLPLSPPTENPPPSAAAPPVDVPPPDGLAANRDPGLPRGPLDLTEHIFSGDAVSRFASARLDPNAPLPPPLFEDEDAVVELELISTGGDPEEEARRAAMIAAHPEGKPIVTFRYGARRPAADGPEPPPADRTEKMPPDT